MVAKPPFGVDFGNVHSSINSRVRVMVKKNTTKSVLRVSAWLTFFFVLSILSLFLVSFSLSLSYLYLWCVLSWPCRRTAVISIVSNTLVYHHSRVSPFLSVGIFVQCWWYCVLPRYVRAFCLSQPQLVSVVRVSGSVTTATEGGSAQTFLVKTRNHNMHNSQYGPQTQNSRMGSSHQKVSIMSVGNPNFSKR